MPKIKKYTDAGAFRRSLEDRLLKISKTEKIDIQKLRRQVAFDRLLARLFISSPSPLVLKGGYAMQLRTLNARATKDIDLAMRDARLASSDEQEKGEAILEIILEKTALDLGDFFTFQVSGPTKELDGAPYGGSRFHVEARMEDRSFEKFQLDIGVGDVWIEPLEVVSSRDWLAFAGIGSHRVNLIPKEQQFAEKIHAYTLPRGDRQNSRVKDLIDMILLIDSKSLDKKFLKSAIKSTFDRRKTHSYPNKFPAPPESWTSTFQALAEECGISHTIDEAFQVVATYLDDILNR